MALSSIGGARLPDMEFNHPMLKQAGFGNFFFLRLRLWGGACHGGLVCAGGVMGSPRMADAGLEWPEGRSKANDPNQGGDTQAEKEAQDKV